MSFHRALVRRKYGLLFALSTVIVIDIGASIGVLFLHAFFTLKKTLHGSPLEAHVYSSVRHNDEQ